MKRLFPRAVPEALITLLFLGGACSPSNNVKSGAPVLTTLSIVDPSGSHVDVTAATVTCATGSEEGMDCDPGTAVCELAANVVCTCTAKDMCDPSIKADAAVTGGTLNCTFPPLSTVLATFDRLLDTTPFEAGATVAKLTADPATTATTASDYSSTGSTTGLVFPVIFSYPSGPHIAVSGNPALPTESTVTIALDTSTVLAKDKKTPFTGSNLLADGKIAFKTSAFAVGSVTVPTAPAPMMMDMGMPMPMGCPDAGTMMPPATDGGAPEVASEAGTTNADGGVDGDAAAPEAGAPEAGAPEAGAATDAAAAIDAPTAETGATTDAGETSSEGGVAEAGTPVPPSTDVPANMNMGAITITFTNNVKMDVLTHITITEDGKPFADFMTAKGQMYPSPVVTLVPNTMWAAGKTYEITIDADTTDALGKKLSAPVPPMSFTMSGN